MRKLWRLTEPWSQDETSAEHMVVTLEYTYRALFAATTDDGVLYQTSSRLQRTTTLVQESMQSPLEKYIQFIVIYWTQWIQMHARRTDKTNNILSPARSLARSSVVACCYQKCGSNAFDNVLANASVQSCKTVRIIHVFRIRLSLCGCACACAWIDSVFGVELTIQWKSCFSSALIGA